MTRILLPLLLVTTFSSFAAGRELAPRELGPTTYSTHLPATAFAGDRFLTVWFEQRPLGTVIMGAFSDGEGRRLSAEAFPILRTPINHSLQLVGTGDSYAMFWRDGAGRTQMADLDLSGRITRQITPALPQHISVRFAWNGMHFLAAMQHPAGVTQSTEAVIFDRAGRIVRSGIALEDQAYWFDIAAATGAFTVVTAGWDGLFAQRVSTATGTTVATTLEPSHGTSANAYRARTAVAIVKDNGDVLVVWSAYGAGTADLKSVVISPGGELSPIHVITAAGVEPVHLMANGDGYTLAVTVPDGTGRFSFSSIQLRSDGSFQDRTSAPYSGSSGWRTPSASNGRVIFLVYEPPSPGLVRVASIAVSANGATTAPELLSIARGRQFQPIAGAGGGVFLAAWPEQAGDETSVRTATVDARGEPSNVRTLQDRAFLGSTDLAWNGNEYLVLTWSGTWLMARRLAFDGTPVDAQPIVIATNVTHAGWSPLAAVTWARDRWIVVYPVDNRMMFASVSRAGVATEPRKLSIDTPLPPDAERMFEKRPAIAFDGSRLLMVWSEARVKPCWFPVCQFPPDEAFAARLDLEGNALDTQPLRLPDEAVAGVSVATSGGEFLVVPNGMKRVLVIEADGASLRIAASEPLDEAGTTDITWDGSSYVVALRYTKESRWYLGLARLSRQGVEIEPMRVVVTDPPELSQAPSIAVGPGLGTLVAIQETDGDGTRAMVYRENELQKTGPRRRSVR